MTCHICQKAIEPQTAINWHHYETLRSEGGTKNAPTHQQCHVEFHSANNHFREWGRQGGKKAALTLAWAFNLRHVRTHPDYEQHRFTYLLNNGLVGWAEGLIY